MISAMFVGGTRVETMSTANRGLNYGDGLFETMRVHHGELPLWLCHHARLREGASRLGIAMPDDAFIEARIAEAIRSCDAGVLKLLLTRGDGGRGYAPAADAQPVWIFSLHALPQPQAAGLRLHWCETTLAAQPRLAGIKHCNRLEQVLARVEAQRAGCDEGLLCDAEGRVVSATSANLLLLREGVWCTPPIDTCGVAGVLRGVLLDAGLIRIATLARADVESADALALCNAVRGILPVAPHPAVDDLQRRLAMAYPMFSKPGMSA